MAPYDRLSPMDAAFLYSEGVTTPLHVGSVEVFGPPCDADGTHRPFDHEALVRLIEGRIGLVPRYRQKVRWVPGRVAAPVWVDDPDFDVTYHVRRSALPRPGTDAQLHELVARLMSRHLDRSRPLWEMYLVEGLSDDRIALISKTHHAMVDGVSAVDLGTVILDASPEPRAVQLPEWQPRREPSGLGLLAGAAQEFVRRPASVVEAVARNAGDVRHTGSALARGVVGVVGAARTVTRTAPRSPLNATLGEARRFAAVRSDLEDYKAVRRSHGGTVNDVVLAVVAGGLRSWLLTRGERVTGTTTVRAMVPVSVRPDSPGAGNRVQSWFVDLPVGEQSPVVRLQRVTYAMQGHAETGSAVGADVLTALSGFAPSTLHSLGARVASSVTRRLFNVVVTNVPGPQQTLYAGGAPMQEVYPVIPLSQGQAVSIGLTSYHGGVFYGLNADRDAMGDVEVLASCLTDALAELVGTVR